MRVTVIFPDNAVYVDGVHRNVAIPSYDPNWRAIQWYDTYGDLEVKVGEPLLINNFDVVAPFVLAWEAANLIDTDGQIISGKPATGVEEM